MRYKQQLAQSKGIAGTRERREGVLWYAVEPLVIVAEHVGEATPGVKMETLFRVVGDNLLTTPGRLGSFAQDDGLRLEYSIQLINRIIIHIPFVKRGTADHASGYAALENASSGARYPWA